MVIALRVSRWLGLATALVAISLAGAARGQDVPPSQQQSPAAAPSAQKAGPAGRRAAETPATAEQHKLPPDSTTKQTLDLPGRSLSFTAIAGSIRLFDDKREPQADIA